MVLVRPADQSGSWQQDADYRFRAETAFRLLGQLDAESRAALAAIEGRRVPREVLAKVHEVQVVADTVVVFSAMAIESFLNFYGVRRLGESYFTAHLERLSPSKKVAALVALCTGKLLEPAEPLLQVAQRIARRRNALVHPKTRETHRGRDLPPAESAVVAADQAIADMRLFFELVVLADPAAGGSVL